MSFSPVLDVSAQTWIKSHQQIVVETDQSSIDVPILNANDAERIECYYKINNVQVGTNRDFIVLPNNTETLFSRTYLTFGGAAATRFRRSVGVLLGGNTSQQGTTITGRFSFITDRFPSGTGFNFYRRFISYTTSSGNPPTTGDIGFLNCFGLWTSTVDTLTSITIACSDLDVPANLQVGIGAGSTFELYELGLPE